MEAMSKTRIRCEKSNIYLCKMKTIVLKYYLLYNYNTIYYYVIK